MKLNLLLILIIFSSIPLHSQHIENDIIPVGYYIKPINPKPALFILFNKSDTLKLLTNKYEKLDEILKVDMIKSIDILKDKEANEKFKKLAKYGVILLEVKDENWENISSKKKNIESLDIAALLKNRNDTIIFKNPKIKLEGNKYKKLSIGENHLIVNENGNEFYDHNIKLLIKSPKSGTLSKESVTLKMDLKEAKEAKEIIEPLFSVYPHSTCNYSLMYDVSTSKIIWCATVDKYIKNEVTNNNGGKLYLNKKGNRTCELIKMDAMTGKIIAQNINEDVEIRIK